MTSVDRAQKQSFWTIGRKWLAGGAVAALIAGTFVYTGIGALQASAAGPKPVVSVSAAETPILGEDMTVSVNIANPAESHAVYNLSATALLPKSVEVLGVSATNPSGGSVPWEYTLYNAGDKLPGTPATGTCDDAGLGGPEAGSCVVPTGKQLLVFENVSDLPASANVNAAIELRPLVNQTDSGNIADGFAVGDPVDVRVNAYTSEDERLLPLFPGSNAKNVNDSRDATSGMGVGEAAPKIKALRITKSEPSPESELLRGVHSNTTIYTLTIDHTGEGNLTNAVVVDYLPAGLEFLGSSTVNDNTTNAGNSDEGVSTGDEEYIGAGEMLTGDAGSNARDASEVDTVELTAAEALDLGLTYLDADGNPQGRAGVYTKVTWRLDEGFLAAGGTVQGSTIAGTPATTTISYRAGVPLFENTVNFTSDVTPGTDINGVQGANLDNNNGPSTRHGSASDSGSKGATSWENIAVASGSWTGKTGNLAAVTSSDSDTETIDAVDVRILKDVRVGTGAFGSSATFAHGNVADYRLRVATSEYVGVVEVGERPTRLVDELANGLCPVYPAGVALSDSQTHPNFYLGEPDYAAGTTSNATLIEWNDALTAAGLSECVWPTTDLENEATFSGATLTGIAFDKTTGHFYQDLLFDAANEAALTSPNANVEVIYSVRQNSAYLTTNPDGTGLDGATSSGDVVENHVELEAKTKARANVNGLENTGGANAGDKYYAWDDSAATVETNYSDMQKYVLGNDLEPNVYTNLGAADIWELDYGAGALAPNDPNYPWTKQADKPFAVGDDVWFKIHWESAEGADVRNPVLTDFLPEGVAFDKTDLDGTNEWQNSDNLRIFPSIGGKSLAESGINNLTLGECGYDLTNPAKVLEAFTDFVGKVTPSEADRRLTWQLGSTKCYDTDNPSVSPDRFWPGGLDLDIYIKVTVTDAQTFGGEDITQNLAKYQQENVDGDIFFLRSQAEIVNDQSAKLVKGIRHFKDHEGTLDPVAPGNLFGSNADGGLAVQGDEVTYRLDVLAPYSDTTGYVLWDALPKGVKKADLKGIQANGTFTASAATVTQTWSEAGGFAPTEATQTGNWTAVAYDPLDPGRPATSEIREDYRDRTIVVWKFNGDVPGSVLPVAADPEADPAISAVPAIPQGLTLGYTVVVPAGVTDGGAAAVIDQEYVNDASVTQLEFENNNGGTSTLLLNGSAGGPSVSLPKTDDPANGIYGFDDAADEASDPSNFSIQGATMGKALYATEIEAADTTPVDANNPRNVIVQGEYAEFDISATIPAKTTVLGGELVDDGVLRWGANSYEYNLVSATLVAPSSIPSGVTLDTTDGSLSFGPSYTNNTTSAQTFTVRLKVWVADADESRPGVTPNFTDPTELTNTARFSYETVDGDPAALDPAQATVTYREPVPTLTKTAGTNGGANGTVTFTLTAGNETGQPTLYDAVVYDCLPAGFSEPDSAEGGWNFTSGETVTVAGKCYVEGDEADQRVIEDASGDGTLITWNVGHLVGGMSKTLQFTAKIDQHAGGGAVYTNRAHIVGYTLPSDLPSADTRRGDRAKGAEAEARISSATIDKQVKVKGSSEEFTSSTEAPVGETVTYQVKADFPANANFYGVTLKDRLPAGVEYVDDQDLIVDFGDNWPTDATTGDTTAPRVSGPNVTIDENSRQLLEWTINPDDIATHTEERSITITFDARITNKVPASAESVTNDADLTWHMVENPTPGTDPQSSTDTAIVNLIDPELTINKQVRFEGETGWNDSVSGGPDQGLEYQIVVTNEGHTASFNNKIVDEVPEGVVSPTNFIVFSDGVPVTTAKADWDSDVRTITWTLPDAIAVNQAVTLGYSAKFAPSAELKSSTNGEGEAQTNTAAVTHFESFGPDSNGPTGRVYEPTDVEDDATATPQFPRVTLTKAAADTSRTAYVGEPFEWVLTATNSGAGDAQQVVLTDTLPANWEFDEMVSVIVAGDADATPRVPAEVGTSPVQLTWTFGSDATGGSTDAILESGQSIEIRFTATPLDDEALETGVGSAESQRHVNTLSAVTTDRTNSTENASRDHTGDDATDYAFLGKADLVLDKSALGGVTNSAAFGDLAVGTWIAGQTAGSNYDQPKWQINVTNDGDHAVDAAYGPFVIKDTPPTPTGVTVGTWTARYHSGPTDTAGTIVGTFPADATSFAVDIGAANSLKTDGSNWISLTTDVSIAANAVSAASGDLDLENTASVLGKTYEDPSDVERDNDDTETKPVEELADLQVQKRITTPATGSIAVGESITYTVDARNNGPSVSRGDITITDTIPAGLTQVTVTNSADWVVTAINGAAATSTDAIAAGDTVTWTYQGDPLLVNTVWTAGVTITATIDRGFTGDLVNWAQVHPDETVDPDEDNNSDDTRITPNDDTVVSVDKVRVVADAAAPTGWRQADPANNAGDAFVAGDPVHYLITVTNEADRADARNVEVVDESPVGLTYTSHVGIDGSAWNRAAGGANLDGASESRWNTFTMTTPATLGESASQSFVVSYDTATTITGDVENWAEVTIDNWDRNDDPGARRDRDDDSTGATRIVDLGIVKSHDPDAPLIPGTEVAYTLVVTNHGASATNGAIEIEDVLPAGLSYVAGSATATVSNGTAVAPAPSVNTDGSTLNWSLLSSTDVFDKGDTITITYRALIDQNVRANVPLKNTVSVDGPDNEPITDPNPNEDDDTITTGPLSATMEIEKTVNSGVKVAGGTATYTLTVKNFGPSAVPATVVDPLVSGLSYISMSGAGWECAETAGVPNGDCVYTANDGLHPAGSATNPAVSTITVVAGIDSSVASGTLLDNTATLTWVDNGTKTDDDDAQITVVTQADLALTKTAVDENGDPITRAIAGDTARYSLSVSNNGPSDAIAPITVVDTLPAGANFVRVISPEWATVSDTSDGTVTFVRTPITSGLAAGATAPELLYEVLFDADLQVTNPGAGVQPLVNTATASSPTPDPDPLNNVDDESLDIVRESSVSVDKGHTLVTPVDEYEIGDEVEFTFDVTNDSAGPSSVAGITVTDTLPAGLAFGSIDTASGWSLVSSTVNGDGTTTVVASYAGEVAPGAAAPQLTMTATVTVAIGDNTEVTNDVCVTGLGNGEKNTNTDPCDTDTITVVPLADLVLVKTVDPASAVSAGQPITWNIAVGNAGVSDSLSTSANPITVTDTVPAGISSVADPSQGDWIAQLNGAAWTGTATAGDEITWVFQGDRIPAGTDPSADPATQFVVLSLTGTIDPAWIDGVAIDNSATVTPGETRDPNEPNNEDEVTVRPGDETNVRIDKTRVVLVDGEWVAAVDQSPVPNFVPGADISYRITVINDGPADARDVVVVDETPAGLTYKAHESIGAGTWGYAAGGSTTVFPDGAPAGRTFGTFALDGTQQVGNAGARVFVVTYETDSAMQHDAQDPLVNEVEVTADNDRTFHPVQRDDDNAFSTRSADLSIVKTHTAPAAGVAAVAGETVTYNLLVKNEGPSVSDQPIQVIDSLPADFSYVAGSASISVNGAAALSVEPAVSGQDLTWADITNGVDLVVDGTVEISFTALIDSNVTPATGVLNAAVVDGPNDTNIENDRSTDPVDITGIANLTIGKTAVTPAADITAGEAVTWLLTPRNAGPSVSLSTAENPITVTDTLPAGIDRLVSDPSNADWVATTSNVGGWSQATAGDTITWTFVGDRFAVGAEPDIEISAIIDAAWHDAEIVNTAVLVPGETPDPELPNEGTSTIEPDDRTTIDIWKNRVVQVDGEWVPAASLAPVPEFRPGTDVTYRIDVANYGSAVARDVQVVDPVPAGLSNPVVTQLDGLGTWASEVVTCEAGVADAGGLAGYVADDCLVVSLGESLQVGLSEMRSFLVTFSSDPAIDPADDVVNWAQARATNVPDSERPTDDESMTGTPGADLSIVKTVGADRVLAGTTVDYRLEVTNHGQSIARGPVTVSDQLPVGLSYVPGTATVSVAGAAPVAVEPTIAEVAGSEELTWTVLATGEALEVDGAIVIELQTQLETGVFSADGLVNTARVFADDPYDYDPTNNESTATIVVDPLVTLSVEKAAVGEFQVGKTGQYEIVVSNSGPTAEPGAITVTDVLPDGLTFQASDGATVTGKTVTWVLPDGLDVGESVTLTLYVNVHQAAYPSVTNVVTIDSPSEKTPESKLVDDETVEVRALDVLSVTGGSAVGYLAVLAAMLMLGGALASVAAGRADAKRRRARARYAA